MCVFFQGEIATPSQSEMRSRAVDGHGVEDPVGGVPSDTKAAVISTTSSTAINDRTVCTATNGNARLLGWVGLPLSPYSLSANTATAVTATTTRDGSGTGLVGVGGGFGGVWFHAPSASLVKELPEAWVAFDRVSGGILADVSRITNDSRSV